MAEKITCTACGENKDPTEFYGKSKRCKACTLARQKELKAAKAKGSGKAAAARKGKKTKGQKEATPPPADAPAFQVPATLGFAIKEVEDGGTTNMVISQTSANGDAEVWLTPVEEEQLYTWLSARRRKRS